MWVNELKIECKFTSPPKKALNVQVTNIKDKNPSNKTYQLHPIAASLSFSCFFFHFFVGWVDKCGCLNLFEALKAVEGFFRCVRFGSCHIETNRLAKIRRETIRRENVTEKKTHKGKCLRETKL